LQAEQELRLLAAALANVFAQRRKGLGAVSFLTPL
jgi:hypothetical protein